MLRGLDPVELAQGVEKKGVDAWTLDHGGSRYLFATEANLRAFETDPARFEIQLGGACGRMGPGSGRGSPSRFAVHDGRIYVFASDQCREAFLKAPEKFLDPDEPAPADDAAARAAGAALVEKAVARSAEPPISIRAGPSSPSGTGRRRPATASARIA